MPAGGCESDRRRGANYDRMVNSEHQCARAKEIAVPPLPGVRTRSGDVSGEGPHRNVLQVRSTGTQSGGVHERGEQMSALRRLR